MATGIHEGKPNPPAPPPLSAMRMAKSFSTRSPPLPWMAMLLAPPVNRRPATATVTSARPTERRVSDADPKAMGSNAICLDSKVTIWAMSMRN